MSTLVVATSEGVALRLDLAGVGSRLVAGMLDLAILLIAYLTALVAVLIPVSFDPSGVSGFVAGLMIGGAVLVLLGYHVFFHVFSSGRTPGKRAVGIRVASADGHPATNLQIVLRALLMPIDLFLSLPLPIGLVAIAATSKHQRLGDLVAGTLVVRVPRVRAAEEPFRTLSWSNLQHKTLPLTPGVAARLTPEDREILRELLTRVEVTDRARRSLFIAAAKSYSARLGLGAFEDARIVIKELYLFARESAPTADA